MCVDKWIKLEKFLGTKVGKIVNSISAFFVLYMIRPQIALTTKKAFLGGSGMPFSVIARYMSYEKT